MKLSGVTFLHALSEFDRRTLSEVESIRRIGGRMLRRRDDLDDFTQEVLLRVYTNREQLRDVERLPQWVTAIARNTAQNWNKRRTPELTETLPEVPHPEPSVVARMESAERWETFLAALNVLSPTDRALLLGYHVDEESYQTLQERHGLSYKTISFRLSRARGQVRRRLAAVGGVFAFIGVWSRQAWAFLLARKMATFGVLGVVGALTVGGLAVFSSTGTRPSKSQISKEATDNEDTGTPARMTAGTHLPNRPAGTETGGAKADSSAPSESAAFGSSDSALSPSSVKTPQSSVLEPSPQEAAERRIRQVLMERYVNGYESEDLSLYRSAFWEDDFAYLAVADKGTPDPADDNRIERFGLELETPKRLFERYAIRVLLTEITVQPVPDDADEMRVDFRYKLTLTPEKPGLAPETPTGRSTLWFFHRDGEWRISRWEEMPDPPK